ncbi:lysylphosphatidylglycerol synthase transmembrane domain-containing protein [Georgenia faecalis]|uniref:Lysylphosphatidylglycerol synthase domain-containing protein n=1 Tax=Georgenia faecalis TaxID=2483799 RepID=A0ABV9D9H6_9MICO|nr:lysylphosphatidylglycerol synthase transmembrane domain-containing protein [Georgenia faecalis]
MTAPAQEEGRQSPRGARTPRRGVLLVDVPETRVRRPGDLVELILSGVGIGMVLLLAVYAHGTALGVTEDVQSAAGLVLRELLLLPVTVLEGLVTFFLPPVIIVLQLVKRRWRVVLEAVLAAVVAALVATLAIWLLNTFDPRALTVGLTITVGGDRVIALNPYSAALAAFFTALGTRSQRPSLRWSWNLLWVVLGLAVIRGQLTLPGAVVTVLLGRAVGLGARYAVGVLSDRANGIGLVRGLRRAGLDPVRVVRLDPARPGAEPRAWTVTTSAPIGYTERAEPLTEETVDGAREAVPGRPPDTIDLDPTTDAAAAVAAAAPRSGVTLDPVGAHRVYSAWDVEGTRWYVAVLDGHRQVVGYLASLWTALRMRGLDHRRSATLRDAADRAALLTYAVCDAGVRTPLLAGIAVAQDSVLMTSRHVPRARRLPELTPEEIDDALLDELWSQLRRAHSRGVAHRDLTANAILVDDDRQVWLLDWEHGEIASSELSRRLDLAQLLTLLAVQIGPERALASAARNLETDELAAIAPLLQPVVLPAQTRSSTVNHRELLNALRAELVDLVPTATVEPVRLERFSVRTVVMVTIAVIAIWVLLGTLNFEQVAEAARDANPVWLVVAFGLGLSTYVGAAMTLLAFSPERLGVWRTTLVQVAASVISLVAPAGVGPAALNIRFLTRRKVETPIAVATVALVQVTQFVTTILLLVTVALVTGSAGTLSFPTDGVGIAAGAVILLAGVTMLVAPLRTWIWRKIGPTLSQVWPRVLWVVGNPRRLAIGIAGNIVMTVGFIAAFGASLAAFGYTLSLTSLSITYLTSNAVGAAVPSPGGIGPVEAALTAGLSVAGIPAGVAFSAALVFRVLTFWIRVPIGWVALRHLQRRGDL